MALHRLRLLIRGELGTNITLLNTLAYLVGDTWPKHRIPGKFDSRFNPGV